MTGRIIFRSVFLLHFITVVFSFTALRTPSNTHIPRVNLAKGSPFSMYMMSHNRQPSTLPSLLAVIPADTSPNSVSYFTRKPSQETVPWSEVFHKVAAKVNWDAQNGKYDASAGALTLKVVQADQLAQIGPSMSSIDVILLVGLGWEDLDGKQNSSTVFSTIETLAKRSKAVASFDCIPEVQALQNFGRYEPSGTDSEDNIDDAVSAFFNSLHQLVFKKPRPVQKHRRAWQIAQDMWSRQSLDDLVFLVFVLTDTFTDFRVQSVQSVTSTETTSPSQVCFDRIYRLT